MIVARLYGGLGNQMFQYAAARSLADQLNTELVLDTHWFDHVPARATPRCYELDKYPVRARFLHGAETWWAGLHHGRLVSRIAWLPRRWQHCRERHFQWDARFALLRDGSYLDGYWQSPRYFSQIADALRADLTPRAPLSERDGAVAARIRESCSISVHVRRGDFVNPTAGATLHVPCSLDYYRAAVNQLASGLKEPHFFVFSDDPVWTRAHLQLPGPTEYVDHNAAASAFQDLRLMSLCQHQIIANSSFSWWAAWLNPHPGKRVVAPQRWFADSTDTSDLIPADWIRC